MSTSIIGINCSGFHSSACLLTDGKVECAITEERLSRIKRDKSFPTLAIEYCLEKGNKTKADISDLFIGWHPRFYLNNSDKFLDEALKDRGKLSYLALNELSAIQDSMITEVKQQIQTDDLAWNIHFVDHHKAHLGNVYYQSGFIESDYVVADGFGEIATGEMGRISQQEINRHSIFKSPHSLGSVYSALTDYLGFRPNADEWKVMALSANGERGHYTDFFDQLIKVDGLNVELDLSYLEHYLFFTPKYYSQKMVDVLGSAFKAEEAESSRACNIVADLQARVEHVMFELLTNLQQQTGGKRLVCSGGFFMNSVLNGKLLAHTPYEELYIGGSPDDSGISVGSAFYGYTQIQKNTVEPNHQKVNYWGKNYADEEIEAELTKRKLTFRKVDNVTQIAAQLLEQGNIIGWFQGASEFGQRALGNRSILANPKISDMKAQVNETIKYREGFRPFAPSVLSDYQEEYFDIPDGNPVYFMEQVFQIKKSYRDEIPAVVHLDGSGRLQTVAKETNPLYYELIDQFRTITGTPVVLNTSFNINGMPMVESPADAINCFYQSGIDVLIMHSYIVEK